jgi:hypothetical protein
VGGEASADDADWEDGGGPIPGEGGYYDGAGGARARAGLIGGALHVGIKLTHSP